MAILFTDYIKEKMDEGKVLNASKWFREQASEVKELDTSRVIKKGLSSAVSKVMHGHLYLFRYDPKLKEELSYYDMFPVTFVVRRETDRFYGINLHYLPYTYRAKLMDALYEYATGEEDLKKLRLTYNILSSVSKLRYYKPCYKLYLNNQVKSRFIHVSPDEWDTALFLPLHKFKKAPVQQVHRDSIAAIRKSNLRGINR